MIFLVFFLFFYTLFEVFFGDSMRDASERRFQAQCARYWARRDDLCK